MAAQQQHQIDSQQQIMVAKEQRLKYLKQQELRHQQMSGDKERLKTLRDRVDAQELKLRKLRALQGDVDQQKVNNNGLSSELENIRALFNEKEKELSVAVAKVEKLTKQLEEIRWERQQNGNSIITSPAAIELEKLRKELLYRNKLNEQQHNRMVQQRETLNNRKDEVNRMDKRISELQQRLQRKRSLNQQLSNQINAATAAKQAQLRTTNPNNKNSVINLNNQNIAAVEPYNHMPTKEHDRAHDDLHTQLNSVQKGDDLEEFIPNKNDPKYQTLPYNTKFLMQKQKQDMYDFQNDNNRENTPDAKENVSIMPSVKMLSTSQSISNLTPKPYFGNVHSNSNSNGIHTNPPTVTVPQIISRTPLSQVNSITAMTMVPSVTTTSVSSNLPSQPQVTNSTISAYSVQNNLPKTSSGDQIPTVNNLSPSVSSQNALVVSTNTVQQQNNKNLPVYQSCSMPVTVVHPQTLSSAPDGSLREVPPESTGNLTNDSTVPKPALPPKPSVPNKPIIPPRQIHNSVNGEKIDTSSESVDSALTILKGCESKSDKKHAGKNVISSFSKRMGSSGLEQYMKSMNQIYKSDVNNADISSENQSTCNEDLDSKKNSHNELPIKSKPLTIKKSTSSEPPKLKVTNGGNSVVSQQGNNNNNNSRNSSVHVTINRRIEMPPAFLFPESQSPPDLKNNQANENEIGDFTTKLVSSPNIVIADVVQLPQEFNSGKVEENVTNPKTENESDSDINGNNMKSSIYNIDDSSSSSSTDSQITDGSQNATEKSSDEGQTSPENINHLSVINKVKKGNLKKETSTKNYRRVSFDPHALLLDASLEGELVLVKKTAKKVPNPSAANDEGITALHNAICAGHFEVVKFLVEYGCDVNAQDSDGWTPLHCAASCNNLPMVKFLVENGACIFATTLSDQETAAQKCEEDEEGYDGCSQYLYSIQEKLGIMNNGVVYAVYEFEAHNADELSYSSGDMIVVLRKGDEFEREWWWSRIDDSEGYIPRNLLGVSIYYCGLSTATTSRKNFYTSEVLFSWVYYCRKKLR
ncbi:Apoptosis-stimulating of p53 protein 1 [Nymphon striatum]|nr:Apoptosis-stimulating of p53 protein 1 [Nymphon striatum]